MLQEIITYMIIGSAFTIAIMKTFKKFSKKKIKKAVNLKTPKYSMDHNCSDCSAECMLRDAIQIKSHTKNQENLCGKINEKSN